MNQLLLASSNRAKLHELKAFMNSTAQEVQLSSLQDWDLPDPIEDGETFKDNAYIKAFAAFQVTGVPTLADDSGFCIAALEGRPGVYSARYAAEQGGYEAAWFDLHRQLLENSEDYRVHQVSPASFETCLCYCDASGASFFQGRVEGSFIYPGRGKHRFAYDSVFQPSEQTVQDEPMTYAEMTKEQKALTSHRTRALVLFLDWFRRQQMDTSL